ncbi:MAG TPA: polyhydroxyalkanoic acid system family protein [Polyangiaceae bacterium]|nr:polyhydroxyalkanoic acid system family protein [Polyangiaceae bacterium]
MKHSVHHGLGKEKAKAVAIKAFESYQQRFSQYDPKANWVTEHQAEISFKAKGISLSGNLEVRDTEIDMDLDVPFILRPFKGKALGVIEDEIKVWVKKAEAGEF